MKKPFKETKLGKFLAKPAVQGVVKGAAKAIPFGIGSLAGSLIDEVNGTKSGQVDKKSIYPILIKIAFYIGLTLMVKYGLIDTGEAQEMKQALPANPAYEVGCSYDTPLTPLEGGLNHDLKPFKTHITWQSKIKELRS